MKMQGSSSIFKQKRVIVVAVAVLIVTAVVGLWVAAGLQRAKISKRVDTQYSKTKVVARVASADSGASRDKRIAAIDVLSRSNGDSDCDGEWWGTWRQTLLSSDREAVKECKLKTKRLKAVAVAAGELKSYLDDDAKIAKTASLLKVNDANDTWQKSALVSAETAMRTLEAMSVTKDNQKLIATSKDKVKAIISTWAMLNSASAKEDKAAYLTAKDELAQAYANLGVISDVSDERTIKLIQVLQVSIDRL